jgi:hypothetical protein
LVKPSEPSDPKTAELLLRTDAVDVDVKATGALGAVMWTYGAAAVAVYGAYMAGGTWPAVSVGGLVAMLMGMSTLLLDVSEARS